MSVFLRMRPLLSNEHGSLSLPRTTKLFLLEGRPFFMGAIYTPNESHSAETRAVPELACKRWLLNLQNFRKPLPSLISGFRSAQR